MLKKWSKTQFCVKIYFWKWRCFLKMKDCYIDEKKVKLERLEEQILKDAEEYEEILILCLGKYNETYSPFLTFATKVSTVLKTNNFPVYGDIEKPLLIEKRIISPLNFQIDKHHPNAFVLVVMNSLSDTKKVVGNLYYENKPFETKDLTVGNATLKLCGSFGKTEEELSKNSLDLATINEIATDVSFSLMRILNEKQMDKNILSLHKEK